MKKNCLNCKHLDYYEAYFEEPSESGHFCNKREEAYKNMGREEYLEKSKVCFEKRNIITLKEFTYFSDWYLIKDRKVDLDKYSYFKLEWRGDVSWYLKHYKVKDGKSIDCYHDEFCLQEAWKAVPLLGDKLRGFHSLCGGSREFQQMLKRILCEV